MVFSWSIIFSINSLLATGTRILPLKPLGNAVLVESMQTWKDNELIVDFIMALTDCTEFVLLAEIFLVGLRVIALR